MTANQKKALTRLIKYAEKNIYELEEDKQALQYEDVDDWAGEVKAISDAIKTHKYYLERLEKIKKRIEMACLLLEVIWYSRHR